VAENLAALGWALLTIAIVILLIDQLFWRPIIAWSDKFRLEQSQAAESPKSWVLDLLRTARIPRLIGKALTPLVDALNRTLAFLTPHRPSLAIDPVRQQSRDRLYNFILLMIVGGLVAAGQHFVVTTVGLGESVTILVATYTQFKCVTALI
jgi:NitT/TauT family transport system permease protein